MIFHLDSQLDISNEFESFIHYLAHYYLLGMAFLSRNSNHEADNYSYISDNSSIVYSNNENDQNNQYDQEEVSHRNLNFPVQKYNVNINDSTDVHLGDRNVYNIDKLQMTAQLKAKRRKQICCFWIFFGALGSGGTTGLALTIWIVEPDANFYSTLLPEMTTIGPPVTGSPRTMYFDFINRSRWDSAENTPTGLPISFPVEKIIVSATGGSSCDGKVSGNKATSFGIGIIFTFSGDLHCKSTGNQR